DRCWRDLTCLHYHHETQPMPNPLSWFFHHLPGRAHKIEVLANHFAQLVVPFFLFTPQPVAGVAGGIIVLTQSWLIVSGNFSWLNFLTVVLAIFAFSDAALGHVLPFDRPQLVASPHWYEGLVISLTVLVAVLSYWPIRNMLSRRQLMNFSFNRLHFVGTYGAFGHITKERYEIILEGTDGAGRSETWKAYEFKGKPGDPKRLPPQVAPYHLRLDWLMWFAAMGPPDRYPWIVELVGRLLEGDNATLKLLRHNPFPDAPPALVAGASQLPQHDLGALFARRVRDPCRGLARVAAAGVALDRGRRLRRAPAPVGGDPAVDALLHRVELVLDIRAGEREAEPAVVERARVVDTVELHHGDRPGGRELRDLDLTRDRR